MIIQEVSKDQDTNNIISGGILTEKLVQSRIHAKNIGKTMVEIKNSMTLMMRVSK